MGIQPDLILLEFVFFSCAKELPPPLRVGFVIWPGSESFYLARDLGYYKQSPIKLLDYPSDSELMRAYRNGDIEAMNVTLDQAWLLAESTTDLRIVLIQDFSDGGDAIVAKPEIKNLQDLKGRRVGVESTTLEAFVLSRALEQVGMSPKDVQIVSLLESKNESVFKQESIDALVTYEPTVCKLRMMGANLLFNSRQIPGEIIDVMVMRESVLTKQLSVAKFLIDGWFRSLDYLQKHPQDAARRIAPHEGVTPEQFLKSLTGIRLPDVQENQKILGKNDATSLAAARRLAKFMVEKNLLKKAIVPTAVFDARLVNDVKVAIFKHQ